MTSGQRYGSYRVVAPLGRGGIGEVYAAEHVLIGKQAAIKVLLPELSRSRESVGRFFHEARSAARIHDPGIVDVFDFGYDGEGNAFIAMELLQGETLGACLARARPGIPFICYVGRQIARVVAAAHAQHIVHRDLKPENVFLVRDPDLPFGSRVKVLDFGMAKVCIDGSSASGVFAIVTQKGALMGTPLYMSPEQCQGTADIDARADVYSLGCVLYEMVCGRPPFVKGGLGMIIGSHIYEPVPKPSDLIPNVPPLLDAILLRALEKDPKRRQQSMPELADELARVEALYGQAG